MNDNTDPMTQAMLNSPGKGEYGGEGPAPSTLAAKGITSPSASRRGEPPSLSRRVATAICQSRTCEGINCCQWPCNGGRWQSINRVYGPCRVDDGRYDDAAREALTATASWLEERWGEAHPGAIAIRQELRR